MKKTLILALAFCFLSLIGYNQSMEECDAQNRIVIEIDGFTQDTGMVYLSLYQSEDQWLKKGYKGGKMKVSEGKAWLVIEDVPEGEYAISFFHDENNNKKLDTGVFGIPKEPTGCSNNAVGKYGPPKWVDAVFTMTKNEKQIIINL